MASRSDRTAGQWWDWHGEYVDVAIDDLRVHPAARGLGIVGALDLLAYAGAPITVSGQHVGSLCVVQRERRSWDANASAPGRPRAGWGRRPGP